MSEQEIIEGNKLIAKFVYDDSFIDDGDGCCYCELPNGMVDFYIEDAKYHSSWDWLMPVWFGILKWGKSEYGINWEQSIGEMFIHIKINKGELEINWLNTNKIENVWFVVVEFIKWYNSCQKE